MLKKRKGPKDWSPRGDVVWEPVWPEFVEAYLETALWSGTDSDGNPLDKDYSIGDFSDEAVEEAIKDCDDFVKANKEDLESVGDKSSHGHDFSLTRNGHGAGFWDRGYGAAGKRLTEAAKAYGSADVYVGDDRKLYFTG